MRTARGGTERTGLTGAGRRKCGSGCRDRQESASWGRRGSGARLSDGNRRGRKMVARDEQKQMAGRAAWGDMVDSAVANMVAWDDALGVMMWVTATSRRKEGLTGTDWRRKAQERERQGLTGTDGRRKAQAGDHRTANKRGAGTSGRCRSRKGRVGRKEQADRKGQAQAQAAGGWRKLAGGRRKAQAGAAGADRDG